MATNVYFSQGSIQEQLLFEDLIIESIKIHGHDVYYIPREELRRDEILNEEFSRFGSSYAIEMYVNSIEGFEGDGDLMSKFGFEIRDQATFVVSKNRWRNLTGYTNNTLQDGRPREGDLVYLPLSNSLFEVKFVEHEKPFYQLNNIPVYQLQCELYEYSGEEFETGIGEIDSIQSDYTSSTTLSVVSATNNLAFETGESVGQLISGAINVIGEVSNWTRIDDNTGTLEVISEAGDDGVYRQFYASNANYITGADTGAVWESKKRIV
jgi:hypothetical protein